jgi:lambda family phage portal protein
VANNALIKYADPVFNLPEPKTAPVPQPSLMERAKGFVDRWFESFAPERALSREVARQKLGAMNKIRKYYDDTEFGHVSGNDAVYGYEASNIDRYSQHWMPSQMAGDVLAGERERIRQRAWNLYRSNPYMGSVVDTLVSRLEPNKIVGCDNAALLPDLTTADDKFRTKAQRLWETWMRNCDTLGSAGRGGQDLVQLLEIALRETIISGECLIYFRRYSPSDARRRGLILPMTIECIDAERLDSAHTGNWGDPNGQGDTIYQGVVMDDLCRRKGYWIFKHHPNSPVAFPRAPEFVDAESTLHVYKALRPSNIRGYSWVANILNDLRQIGDLKFTELQSSIIAATFAMWIDCQQANFDPGLLPPRGESPVDYDGNRKFFSEPGALQVMPPGQTVKSANLGRPNGTVNEYIDWMLHGMAGGAGVKAVDLTQNFKEQSFSADAANENAMMAKTLIRHDWFISTVMEPIYAEVMRTGFMSGYFDDVYKGPWDEIGRKVTEAKWPKPSRRSVNPVNDIKASIMAMVAGLSDPQVESAKNGTDWARNMEGLKCWLDKAEQIGLPKEWLLSVLQVNPQLIEGQDPSEQNPNDGP